MGFTEISDFQGEGSRKTNIKGEGIALKEVIGQFADLRGEWPERGGRVFLRRGVDTPVHTMSSQNNLKVTTNYYEKNSYHKELKNIHRSKLHQ